MEDKGATRVLYALKSAGPQSADALARRLKVTVVAARQQLGRLLEKGLVTFEDRREGVGRPKRVWSLSEAGHARFPDSHATMTVDLIHAIGTAFGFMLSACVRVDRWPSVRSCWPSNAPKKAIWRK
jgi:predicted ArsR family transcriptional regulator